MRNLNRFLFATVATVALSLTGPALAQMMHGDKGMQGQPAPAQGGQTMGEHGMKGQAQMPSTQGQSQMPGMQGQSQMPGMQGQTPQPGAGGTRMPMGGMMNCNGMCSSSGPEPASMPGMTGMQVGPGMMQMMMQRRMGEIPSDHIEGRIAFLRAELRITSAQTAAWNDVEAALRANARRVAEAQPAMATKSDMSPLEKANQQERVLAARLDSLRALKPAYAKLYGLLDDAQKKVADELMVPYLGVI